MSILYSWKTQLDKIHRAQDYVNHGDLLTRYARLDTVEYRHASFLFDGGSWQRNSWVPLRQLRPIPGTLVIGHSDRTIDTEIIREITHEVSIREVFASNLHHSARAHPRIHDLPLGIPNRDRSTKTHRIQSSRVVLRLAWQLSRLDLPTEFRGVYSNFSVRTNPDARRALAEFSRQLSHVYAGVFDVSLNGRLKDLMKMGHFGLALCPRGHGLDTHRVWEALLVGAFPVVLLNSHSARVLQDLELPHLALKGWNQLADADFLRASFNSLKGQDWNAAPLSNSYWMKRIEHTGGTHT